MSKSRAVLLILTGATFMSFVGLLMRLLETQDGFMILGYRSITLAGMVMCVACLLRRVSPLGFLRSLDKDDLAMGSALGIAFSAYVFAMLNTTVASALFVLSASPLFAALFAWAWIGERPSRFTVLAMIGAVLGVGVMVQGGIALGQSFGNFCALMSAICFALMLTIARKSRKPDVLGGTFLAGVFCLIVGLALAGFINGTLSVSVRDLAIILFMGGFTIGIGVAFVTWGTTYVPAAEVGLLVLLESVLGPIWVWLFIHEALTPTEIFGGAIVLVAVAGQAISAARRTSSSDEIQISR